jgi:hypothetical protein
MLVLPSPVAAGAGSHFGVPDTSKEIEALWLSRDIDFTGLMSSDALHLLPHRRVTDEEGRQHVEVEGIRLGFAEVGVTFDPQEALQPARVAQVTHNGRTFEVLICDPVTLCVEKQALLERRGTTTDLLHVSTLKEFVGFEACSFAEKLCAEKCLSVAESKRLLSFLVLARKKVPTVLQDERLKRRVSTAVQHNTATQQLVRDLLLTV